MITRGNVLKHHKGVGTIVGAAFFLMIFFTGYMYYQLSNTATTAQQKSLSAISDFEKDRLQENVTCSESSFKQNGLGANVLNVTITNNGPKLVNVTTVGFYDGNSWSYDKTLVVVKDGLNWLPFKSVQLSPWESGIISVYKPGIVETSPIPYQIQCLTERGTIKLVRYN
jgi:hypothetical protein